MDKTYDLHKHTYCVVMYIGKKKIAIDIFFTSNRRFRLYYNPVELGTSIAYNKRRTDVTCLGWDSGEEKDKDDIVIDNFRNRLYKLFKKDKETWEEEDKFLMKAVSDYLPLAVKKTTEKKELIIENFDLFHYAFVVPSEWEEEIREDILRPIFIQSGLISKEDHRDRLLFFTDVEAICYHHSFKRGENTILCRITPEEEETIIKFDLIQTTTTLFNIPDAKFFPTVVKSNSVSVPKGNFDGRIKDFLRTKLFPVTTADDNGVRELLNPELVPSDQDQIIKAIMDGINSDDFPKMYNENEEKDPEKKLWITFKKEWMLNESQKEFINSLCRSTICAEIGTFVLDYVKDIISNNFTKNYKFLLVTDNYSDWIDTHGNYIKWLVYILEYNIRFLNSAVTITIADLRINEIETNFITNGAGISIFQAIQHSDIHCKPQIVASADLNTSSSIFLNSKPDAIINLDISLGSTLFSCLILDENGLIQQIFDHSYFIQDKHLPPLGHFYTFSTTTTLNVKEQFIPFAERYLLGDLGDLVSDDRISIKKDPLLQMKSLLTKVLSEDEMLASINYQKYIKAFILMYMIYIKEEILYKLPDQIVSDQMDMKIGYNVSIEAMLLRNTLENKDNLRNIIYASGLVPKDDHSKKLRITSQGEKFLPAIQKSLELELSLKSYFLLCQLHEDYVQLSLHQVVTAPSPKEKKQESIIVQDEIIPIQNVYDSLCWNTWYNLQQDSSLIELCEIHRTSDNSKIFELLSSDTKAEFFCNLKGHISVNVLQNNPNTQSTYTINLASSCSCKVSLTASDIIDISFTPVLRDIACTLSAALFNKELFGNYMNIDYLLAFLRFNGNPQLQSSFARILEEEAENFSLELGIDTSCLVVPELFSQLLLPVIVHRPLCYKDFKIGALQQVYGENYVFSIYKKTDKDAYFIYKSELTDTATIKCGPEIVFPFLNKGEVINNIRSNRKFYLRSQKDYDFERFDIGVWKFETMNYLENNETLSRNDNIYQYVGNSRIYIWNIFKWNNVDIPVMVSIKYVSYTSTFQFTVKIVGTGTRSKYYKSVVEIGEPLTLTRF